MEEINNINCNYTIDKSEKIIQLGKNWNFFASENEAGDNCQSEIVLNNYLWDYIQGEETKIFYKIILKRLRETIKPLTICHRCDSASKRRFMVLDILPKNNDEIYFNSYLLGLEDRKPVKLLTKDINRSQDFVRMCSCCKKVFSNSKWVEIEEYIATSKIFNKQILPKITHGICTICYDITMKELKKLKN